MLSVELVVVTALVVALSMYLIAFSNSSLSKFSNFCCLARLPNPVGCFVNLTHSAVIP